MTILSAQEILDLPKYSRINLINTLSGPKSGNLIGTVSTEGVSNLAVFNTVTHIGANPPYLGFIMRPLTVERHTYENIKQTGHFTINPINSSIIDQAHQTSAKYDSGTSEYDATGLTEVTYGDFPVPFVKESNYGIGLSYQEEQPIQCNGTVLIIGKDEMVYLPESGLSEDYSINYEALNSVAIGGLDTYFSTKFLDRKAFARP